MDQSATPVERRAARQALRRASNRTEILDAAEKVFGQDGIHDGALRKIAAESGFSTAAIYLFFENKQHLLAETLTRRGDELTAVLRRAADRDRPALERLHGMVDVTGEFFAERPHFRQLLRHIRGGTAITGPVLAEFSTDVDSRFRDAMDLITHVVRDGQRVGEIRGGDARALAHMFSVLVNEYVLLASIDDPTAGSLTPTEFHNLIDGALRNPPGAP